MRIANFLAAAAAVSMAAVPVVANAQNPAAPLSVASAQSVRAHSKLKNSSGLAPVVIAIVVIVAVTGTLIATGAIGNDDNSESS